jgi:predicted transcriptional regulator
MCGKVASPSMKKVKAPTSKKKTTTAKPRSATPTSKAKTKAKAKVTKSIKKPKDYLVLVFCGRSYKSVITTLVTTDKKEAHAEAKWLVSRAVSEKGDKIDVAVFNSAYSWDDKKGWEFF